MADLFVIASRSVSQPHKPPLWHGRDALVGILVTQGQALPFGLRGWRTEKEAQKALDDYLLLQNVILRTNDRTYRIIRMGPKEKV